MDMNFLNRKNKQKNMSEELNNNTEQEELATDKNTEDNTSENNLEVQIGSLQKQVEEQKDKFLRLYADFDNYKKRTAKERSELILTAGKDIMTAMLPVSDDMDRAIKYMNESEDLTTIKEGLNLVYAKFKNTLEQNGLKSIPSIGEIFDVEKHEAITEIPAPNDEMKGKVVDEVEKGYSLNGKVIRFAKVVVGS
jgi:molecular chaperone GrpE